MRLFNIEAVEYYPNGALRRVEFRDMVSLTSEEVFALTHADPRCPICGQTMIAALGFEKPAQYTETWKCLGPHEEEEDET